MGYYTRHDLEDNSGNYDLISQLREESEEAKYAIDSNGECEEQCKWYSHEKELRAFSAKHPDVTFMLSGEGEEPGDIWREYYKGGRMQKCKAIITFDDYDERKLK
jgi:hypothetical protein